MKLLLSGKAILNLLSAVFAAFLLCACYTVPHTGRTQFVLTSHSEEANLGREAWQQIISQEKRSRNRAQIDAVNRVGRAIAEVVKDPGFAWEFRVFENNQPNAFCLPGGKVGVYSGIFQYMANDAELAAVVGHEIGHAIARHGGERVTQGMIQQVGAAVIAESLGETAREKEIWLLAYGGLSTIGVILPYSRTHEYEADHLGLIYMAEAGYDPRAALSFWEKFGKLSQGGEVGEFLSTHPMGPKRLAEMEQLLPTAMEYYQKSPVKHGLGVKY